MDIGKLNRKVKILFFVSTKDEYGGEDGEWMVVDERWARIEPASGKEYFTSQQVTAETTAKITLRYNPLINVLNRIQYGDTIYEIIGVVDDKTEHKATILNCKEMVSRGLQREAEES